MRYDGDKLSRKMIHSFFLTDDVPDRAREDRYRGGGTAHGPDNGEVRPVARRAPWYLVPSCEREYAEPSKYSAFGKPPSLWLGR